MRNVNYCLVDKNTEASQKIDSRIGEKDVFE